MPVQTYITVPTRCRAMQWLGENLDLIHKAFGANDIFGPVAGLDGKGPDLMVNTVVGIVRAHIGDWIVEDSEKQLFPVKPGAFAIYYQPTGE